MDEGKRPMNAGSSRSERRDYQRPVKDERSIKKRNEQADLKTKKIHGWNMFYNKMRKYTNRKNRKGKDWVLTEDKVADEAERYPEVKKLWNDRMGYLIRAKCFTEEEFFEQKDALREECKALQKKLDEHDEAEWWVGWSEGEG